MVYTTNHLISDAYHASGVVSREFETVSGSQVSDGLQWLNDILADKGVDQGMLPYESQYNFIAQPGVSRYFVPGLTQIDTFVFYLNSVRYAMRYTQRNQFFGSSRVENIQTLPYEWYFERQNGGGNIYIYFAPDKNYPIEIHGSFSLTSVKLGQNLSANETVADLGVPIFYGEGATLGGAFYLTASLSPGQFVVNNVDLMGTYADIGALVNYINTGIIPGVQASVNVNNFILTSSTEPPVPIYIQSAGYAPNGTRFISNVTAATTVDVPSTYDNSDLGFLATLTAPIPNVPLIIDGQIIVVGQRVLIKNQITTFENGSYILSQQETLVLPWILTRTTNYDEAVEIGIGNLFTALNGTVNFNTTFVQTQDIALIGVSPILFQQFTAITFSNFSTIQSPNYDVFNAGGFENFYTSYLRYALADRICAEYSYDTPINVTKQIDQYEAWIKKQSRLLDLTLQKQSTLQKGTGLNYAMINIGRGFSVPS